MIAPLLLAAVIDLASPEGRAQAMLLYGADAGDNLCSDVANGLAVGDFDGDGKQDLLLGSHHADSAGNARPDAGEAQILFGGAHFRRGTTIFLGADAGTTSTLFLGARAKDFTGRAVAAGDVNGDGIADAVVTARFHDGPEGTRTDAGEVSVFLGGSRLRGKAFDLAAPEGSHGELRLLGERANDQLGFTATAGDINGDGLAELLLGAFFNAGIDGTNTNAGEVVCLWGARDAAAWTSRFVDLAPPGKPSALGEWRLLGDDPYDILGWQQAVGDIDGDGIGDAVLSYAGADANGRKTVGRVMIVWGEKGTRSGIQSMDSNGRTCRGETRITGRDAEDFFGFSIAVADFDGDGRADLAIGASKGDGPNNTRKESGEVDILFGDPLLRGQAFDIEAKPEWLRTARIFGGAAEAGLAYSMAASDINADGLADLAIGSIGASPNGRHYAGEIVVVAGAKSLPTRTVDLAADAPLLRVLGGATEDLLGYALEGGFDLDGDGVQDLAGAAWRGDNPRLGPNNDAGFAVVLFGSK